jgi:hypothetical protein
VNSPLKMDDRMGSTGARVHAAGSADDNRTAHSHAYYTYSRRYALCACIVRARSGESRLALTAVHSCPRDLSLALPLPLVVVVIVMPLSALASALDMFAPESVSSTTVWGIFVRVLGAMMAFAIAMLHRQIVPLAGEKGLFPIKVSEGMEV